MEFKCIYNVLYKFENIKIVLLKITEIVRSMLEKKMGRSEAWAIITMSGLIIHVITALLALCGIWWYIS